MKPYDLVIDHEACWGCRTCEVACKQETRVPEGVRLIYVSEHFHEDDDGRLRFSYRVNLCRHCDDPPCSAICPEEAIYKRDDGIVVLEQTLCSGCRACLDACPYDAIDFDPQSLRARKCNLCYQRIDHGLLPACADNVCLAHCIYFGDTETVEKQRRQRLGSV